MESDSWDFREPSMLPKWAWTFHSTNPLSLLSFSLPPEQQEPMKLPNDSHVSCESQAPFSPTPLLTLSLIKTHLLPTLSAPFQQASAPPLPPAGNPVAKEPHEIKS